MSNIFNHLPICDTKNIKIVNNGIHIIIGDNIHMIPLSIISLIHCSKYYVTIICTTRPPITIESPMTSFINPNTKLPFWDSFHYINGWMWITDFGLQNVYFLSLSKVIDTSYSISKKTCTIDVSSRNPIIFSITVPDSDKYISDALLSLR